MQKDKSSNQIKSVNKAISVLTALSYGYSKISDIAREVKISKNGVYRLLYSLKQANMVVQNPLNREYYIGPLLFELSTKPLLTHQYLINCAYVELEELRQTIGETVSLHIKIGADKIRLTQLMGTHNIAFIGTQNIVDPLWNGAAGKVLLAQLSEKELEVILSHIILVPRTPFSTTDKRIFMQEILKVKERGYAINDNETELGVVDLATPIEDYVVPASISVVGPHDRMVPRMMDYVAKLKAKAKKISRTISTYHQ